jgi:hypothetical protein
MRSEKAKKMAGEQGSELFAVVCERLFSMLPPNVEPEGLRELIAEHRDWGARIVDPHELERFEEQIFQALWNRIHAATDIDDVHLCPQCGKPQSAAAGHASAQLLCSACGHQSAGLFSTKPFESRATQIGQQLPKRFVLKEALGEGSYGVVYRVWDSKLQREVAIKIPKVERLDRDIFLREARAASRLNHPNVVRIYDVGEIGGLTFIVSDLIKGTTLGRWAAATQPTISTSCQVMLKIAQAIEHAHRADVIHRDLKPGNILIDNRLEPVVLDFGLSHSRTSQFETIAKHGSPLGTPAFMSPEQVQGRLDRIDTWTDVYGMGVILYYLVTRTLPFAGVSESIYEEIVHRPIAPPRQRNPQIDVALEAIILKALQKNPQQRYTTAHEFAADLRLYLAGERVSVYRGWDRRVLKSYGRRYWVSGVAVLALSGLVAVWSSWRGERLANSPLLTVLVQSEPPNAELTWIRMDPETGEWDLANPIRSMAGQRAEFAAGFYKVLAKFGKDSFEVYRTVPVADQAPIGNYLGVGALPHKSWLLTDGVYSLESIRFVPVGKLESEMVFVAGGEILFAPNPSRPYELSNKRQVLGEFLIDKTEVTNRELLKIFPNFQASGELDPDAACVVDWDIAVAYAEKVGKNLPDLWELLFVATNGGTTAFPWGNDFVPDPAINDLSRLGMVDQTQMPLGVRGLVTGVAEWTVTHTLTVMPEFGIKTGGVDQFRLFGLLEWSEARLDPIQRSQMPPVEGFGRQQTDRFGFRCVRRLESD